MAKNKKTLIWKIREIRLGNLEFKVIIDPKIPKNEIWIVNDNGIKKFIEVEVP